MKTKTQNGMSALAALLVTATSYAGPATPPVVAAGSGGDSALTGSVGLNVVSGYVFRGQVLDRNLAYQPTLSLSTPIDLSFLHVDSAALQLQTTQSLNQNAPLAGWFRSEVDLGVKLTKGLFVITPSYQVFNSPTGKFDSAQGVSVKVGLKECCAYGLNPYGRVFFGTQGNANNGTSPGTSYEFGVAPSFKVGSTTVTVPAAVGFGSGNYYANDQTYGYTTVGVRSSTPIAKNLNLTAGVDYWNTSRALGNGQQNFVTTSVGLNLTF